MHKKEGNRYTGQSTEDSHRRPKKGREFPFSFKLLAPKN